MKRALVTLALVASATTLSAQSSSVYTEDLTWQEIRDAIAAGKTSAIVYVGGTEQNGPHMTLVKHNAIAHYAAGKIAERLGNALVYPTMPFSPAGDGIAKTGHARFPGTVTLSPDIFYGVVRQIALSALAGGFKNVFLMGDHGQGQAELKLAAESLDADWKPKGARVFYVPDVYTKWTEQVNAYLAQRKIPGGGHAGVSETSQIMFLDQQKQWIRSNKLTAGRGQPEPSTGINGDPSPASAEMGKIFLDFKINDGVEQIKTLVGDHK